MRHTNCVEVALVGITRGATLGSDRSDNSASNRHTPRLALPRRDSSSLVHLVQSRRSTDILAAAAFLRDLRVVAACAESTSFGGATAFSCRAPDAINALSSIEVILCQRDEVNVGHDAPFDTISLFVSILCEVLLM